VQIGDYLASQYSTYSVIFYAVRLCISTDLDTFRHVLGQVRCVFNKLKSFSSTKPTVSVLSTVLLCISTDLDRLDMKYAIQEGQTSLFAYIEVFFI
jgi:hypothetical protein